MNNIIPLNPRSNNISFAYNTPGHNYLIGSSSIGSSYTGTNSTIISGSDVKVGGNSMAVISATQRPFESDQSGTIFLRADNGVLIETTEPGEFVNASEELGKIDDILDELRQIKEMLSEIYWAPNGPGYLKAQSSFQAIATQTTESDEEPTESNE
jgi:hypothetical protein